MSCVLRVNRNVIKQSIFLPLSIPSLGSVGVPAPGTEVKIVDENGKECPVGVSGEILSRSGQTIKGYWNKSEATASTFLPDGFYRTGDIGRLDEEGFLFVLE